MAERDPADKQHQRQLKDLKEQGRSALTWGLPNPVTEAAVVGFGLVLRDRLADKSDPARATAAAELAEQMLDKTTSRMTVAGQVACTKGCAYCCHSVVSVSAPEAFRVARAITEGRTAGAGMSREAVLQRVTTRGAAGLDALMREAQACPLLVEGACGVYADRPMGCRQFFSLSQEACRTAYEAKTGDFPFVGAAANAGLIVRALLVSASGSLGLRHRHL